MSDIVMGNVVLNFKTKLEEVKQARTGFDALQQDVIALNQAFEMIKSTTNAFKNVVFGLMNDFAKSEESFGMLRSTINLLGVGTSKTFDTMKNFASEMQNITGLSDEVVIDMQRMALQFGVLPNNMDRVIKQAIGLSKTLGVDTSSALRMVTEAMEGNVDRLQRYIPALRSAESESDRLRITTEFLNNAWTITEENSGNAKTTMAAFAETWGDLREMIGEAISDVILPVIKLFKDMFQSISPLGIKFFGLIGVIGTLTTIGVPAIAAFRIAWLSLSATLQSSMGVFGLVAFTVGAVVAIFSEMKNKKEKEIETTKKLSEEYVKLKDAIGETYANALTYGRQELENNNIRIQAIQTTLNLRYAQANKRLQIAGYGENLQDKNERARLVKQMSEDEKAILELVDRNKMLQKEVDEAQAKYDEYKKNKKPGNGTDDAEAESRRRKDVELLNQYKMDMYNVELKWEQAKVDKQWEIDEAQNKRRLELEELEKSRLQAQMDWTANMLMSSWQSISTGVGAIFEDMFRLDKAKKSLLEYLKMFGMAVKEAIVKAIRAYEIEALAKAFAKGWAGIPEALWITVKYEALAGALSAIKFAEGGVVDRPTLAILGEAGQREFVTPEITFEEKFDALAKKFLGNSGGKQIVINYYGSPTLASHEEAAKEIIPRIDQYLKNFAGDSV